MKPSRAAGAAGEMTFAVDVARCIAFMGPENAMYATQRANLPGGPPQKT